MCNYVKVERGITACFPRTLPDESFWGGRKSNSQSNSPTIIEIAASHTRER